MPLVLGGPGLSGVSLVLETGESLQGLLGDDYDMIGFDPRFACLLPVTWVYTD